MDKKVNELIEATGIWVGICMKQYPDSRCVADELVRICVALAAFENSKDEDLTLCLYLFIMLTIVEKNLDIIDEYSTHPPAIYRLANIIKFMSDNNFDEKIILSATNLLKMAQSVPNSKVLREFYEDNKN